MTIWWMASLNMKPRPPSLDISAGHTVVHSEIDSAMMAHDLSMHEHPGAAAQGRLMKEMMPVFQGWLGQEDRRGSTAVVVLTATEQAVLSLLMTALLNLIKPAGVAETAPVMRRHFIAAFDRALAQAVTHAGKGAS